MCKSAVEQLEKKPNNSREPDIPIEQATAVSVSKDLFDREFKSLKEDLEEQKNISWGIVIGVVIAFIIAIGVIIIENKQNADSLLNLQNQYFQEIKELREINFQTEFRLQKQLEELKDSIKNDKQTHL